MSKLLFHLARLRAGINPLALALVGFWAAPYALAQANSSPPERMTYQGFLADGNGNPLGNTNTGPKNYDVIFRIWAEQSGGAAALWAEQQTVTVDKGYFSVLLGEGTAVAPETNNILSSLFTNPTASDRFVEMTVKGIGPGGGNVTIQPRLRLLSSPYSFLSQSALKLVSSSGGDLITAGTLGAVNITGTVNAPTVNATTVNATTVNGTHTGNGSGLTGLTASQIPNLDGSKITGNLDGSKITGNVDGSKIAGTISGSAGINGMIQYSYGANDRFGLAYLPASPFTPATAIYRSQANPNTSIQFGAMGASSFFPDMTIAGNGNVGIGTANPNGNRLQINDQFTAAQGYGLQVNSPSLGAEIQILRNFDEGGIGLLVDNAGYGSTSTSLLMVRNNLQYATAGGQLCIGLDVRANANNGASYVGIGQYAGSYTLQVNGGVGAISFVNTSDARYKKDVQTLKNALSTVEQLRGVSFDWRREEFPGRSLDKGRHLGFIAQEVQKVLPEVVSADKEGFLSLGYTEVVPLLVEAIKEQQKNIQSKDARITALEERLTNLEAMVQVRLGAVQKTNVGTAKGLGDN